MHPHIWSLVLLTPAALAGCIPKQCLSVTGDITIPSYQLYPENAYFDQKNCVAYFSVLYNTTIAAYDPYQNKITKTLDIPGLSGNPLLHVSGVKVDPLGQLSIVVDAGAAFDTTGQDISGDNFLVKYSLEEDRVLWKQNLTSLSNGVYSGYQDIEHDQFGNTFTLGTFPSSLIRVKADGTSAEPWFLISPPDHTVHGFTGLVTIGNTLVVADNRDGQICRFDLRAKLGTPTRIALSTGDTPIGHDLDGAFLPPRYSDKVLLVSDNNNGTIVLRSDDKWETAQNLGAIPNALLSEGGSTVASLQIGQTIYSVTEFFGDDKVAGRLAGNRSSFPLLDITDKVEQLLRA